VDATVIPNIVDTTNFIYKDTKKKDKHFTFISTGRLIKSKRMDLLITSFTQAFKNNNKVKLFIYGDGPERTRLEELIYKSGLEEQIYLMGLVDRSQIAGKMSESDCFVLASQLETFGVAYIEALSMGLPVIA